MGLCRAAKYCDAVIRELGTLVLWQDSPDHDPVDLDLDPTNQTHGPGSRAAKYDQSDAPQATFLLGAARMSVE